MDEDFESWWDSLPDDSMLSYSFLRMAYLAGARRATHYDPALDRV
jgi:hypothetical protein